MATCLPSYFSQNECLVSCPRATWPWSSNGSVATRRGEGDGERGRARGVHHTSSFSPLQTAACAQDLLRLEMDGNQTRNRTKKKGKKEGGRGVEEARERKGVNGGDGDDMKKVLPFVAEGFFLSNKQSYVNFIHI